MCIRSEGTTNFVVLEVVIPVVNVVSTEEVDLATIFVLFPIKKIDMFEEFLFVEFELADHGSRSHVWDQGVVSRRCRRSKSRSVALTKFSIAK